MLAIVQPLIPHYREEFFLKLKERLPLDVYQYERSENVSKGGFLASSRVETIYINTLILGRIIAYNPLPLLKPKYSKLLLTLNFGHLTVWFLLLTKFLHKKKIYLWGHGISVKRFIKEESQPSLLLKWMIKLADGVAFYTEHERNLWLPYFPDSNLISFDNTISGIENIHPLHDRSSLKEKLKITQETIVLYCARFNIVERRPDLLELVIQKSDPKSVGFIIIGDGALKPDFGKYTNVYDFGRLYDENKKRELFSIADIYFQPGWTGLSIVEAMAYGKPIFTFKRSEDIKQCVEYAYIQHGVNGLLFESLNELVDFLNNKPNKEAIEELGRNAYEFSHRRLTIENMVDNALKLLAPIS